MKKYFFILFSILFISLASGQINSGKIGYNVRPPKNVKAFIDTTGRDPQFKQWILKKYNSIKKTAPYLTYSLNFNTHESTFKRPRSMRNDNGMNLKETAEATGAIGVFYSNTSENLDLHQFKAFGKNWLVKAAHNQLDWHISDETREIQGYKCQKATAFSDYLNPTTKKAKITAWFCPDLPYQYGPRGASGLPGLVLGLTYNHYYFHATSINLSKKSKKINKPTKGKLLTHDEYVKAVIKASPGRPPEN